MLEFWQRSGVSEERRIIMKFALDGASVPASRATDHRNRRMRLRLTVILPLLGERASPLGRRPGEGSGEKLNLVGEGGCTPFPQGTRIPPPFTHSPK